MALQITLKAARCNKRLTQKEAAELIGVNESTISNYENGISYPDVPIIKKIEEVYGVAYDQIIFFNLM